MITFFTIPRPFVGEHDKVQRAAIESWRGAVPDAQIILFGSAGSVAHALNVTCGGALHQRYNKPVTDAWLFGFMDNEPTDWLCFISADIILSATLPDVLSACAGVERPFIIGRRWDVERGAPKHTAELHASCGVDYFIYRPGTIPTDEIPPFIVSGGGGDNWFVWKAVEHWNMTVIDATEALTAIHVNHGHPEWENGKQGRQGSPEQLHNRRLYRADGMPRPYGVDDAPWVLTNGQLVQRKRVAA